ncbi:MAG: transketolase [Polyangiaceae bacterium]|jgi:transketolase|nr:transketolase [Polyangiaceae bacterium]
MRRRIEYHDLLQALTRMTGAEKHAPSATSTLDTLHVLYDRVLDVAPARCDDPGRDRFVLSKGHGPMAYYAVLAARGFFPPGVLDGFGGFDSPLGHHPDRSRVPGVEVSSGSLGHGLPIAVGIALALRAQRRERPDVAPGNSSPGDTTLERRSPRVVVMLGDAELEEGSNHEAIAFAARTRLDTLTAIVIDNDSASLGWPGGIARRFEGEGWLARTVDGRDHDALERALIAPSEGPLAVVAKVEPKHG